MNLKALTEQRAEKQTEMETLLNTVKTEERAFTEDENELFKKLESEIGLINETISAITKGRELTEEPAPEQKEEEKKEEDEMKENEQRALQEEKAFESYIRGVVLEERADVNLTKGDNGAVIPETIAKKIEKDGIDLGYVGDIVKVNTRLLKSLIDDSFIPIIAPIGSDDEGNTYNINADYAAVAIAAAMQAEKLVFLTDVEGVLKDKDDASSLISFLSDQEAKQYIKEGIIKGGMIPKVECCMEAIEKGVSMVHILDGRKKHALVLEIYTPNGIGTMLYKKKEDE